MPRRGSRCARVLRRLAVVACAGGMAAAGLLSVPATAAVLPGAPGAVPAASGGRLTATYAGTWAESVRFDYTSAGTYELVKISFSYTETQVVNTTIAGDPVVSRNLELTGSESYSGTHDPEGNCTASLKAAPPGPSPIYFRVLQEDQGTVTASPYLPGAADIVTNGTGNCSEAVPDDDDLSAQWTTAVNPTDTFPASQKSDVRQYPVKYSGSTSQEGLTTTVKVKAKNTLTVSLSAQTLQIIAIIAGKRAAVQDTTASNPVQLAVGQRVTLEVQFSNDAPLRSPEWHGIDKADVIGSYTWVPHRGEVTPFDEDSLRKQHFSFYWTTGGAVHISVTAVDAKTGDSYPATADFDVQAPEVSQFTARTCAVGLAARDGATIMSFGNNPGCHAAGITWTFSIKAPAAAGGHVGLTQLITEKLEHDHRACLLETKNGKGTITNAYLANGEFTALDDEFWYSTPVDVRAGRLLDPPAKNNDSPWNDIFDKGSWLKVFDAADWLMFQPDGTGSIPVAIGFMDWHFTGVARWKLEPFQMQYGFQMVASSGDQRASLSSTAAAGQPEWKRLIEGGTDIHC